MKSLATRQAELVGRNARSFLSLARLRSYTDKAARTGAHDFYFGDRAAIFDYGNAGTLRHFDPFLLRVEGSLRLAMEHLPEEDGRGDAAGGRGLSLVLHNGAYEHEGARLIAALRAYNLVLSDVELAQLDRDPVRDPALDLRDLVGDEHVVFFRGEVEQVASVTAEEITLALRSREPEIPWRILSDAANNDPRDLGKRLPLPYGARKRVPCLGVTVGAATTLAQELTAATTGNVKVGDASGFPAAGTFTLRVAGEEMTAAFVNGTTVNVTARGINSTTAAAHLNGTVAVEMVASAVFCCAGFAIQAVDALWILNPFSDEWVRVDNSALYSVNLAATVSGGTAATVTFTAANLRTLLNGLEQQALVSAQPSVSQQPTYSISEEKPRATIRQQSTALLTGQPDYSNTIILSGEIDANFATSGTGGQQDRARFTWGGIDDPSLITRWRFRVKYGVNTLGVTNPSNNNAGSVKFNGTGLSTTTAYLKGVYDNGVFAVGSWNSAGAGGSVNDLNGETLDFWSVVDINVTAFSTSSDGFWVSPDGVEIEYELLDSAVTAALPAVNATAAIAAAEFGQGLKFCADVRGPVASGGNYSVANGTLLENAPDILRHIIAELCGEGHTPGAGHTAPEAASFTAATTALGAGFKMALELTDLGDEFGGISQRIAFEAASNLVLEELAAGSVWRLLTPTLSGAVYRFPAPTVTVDEWAGDFEEIERNAAGIFTRFRALYDRDATLGDGEESYRGVLRADLSSNDLAVTWVPTADFTAAEAKYGRRDHDGYGFRCIADAASAKFVLGYYAQEHMRAPAAVKIPGVPWLQSYALERGDTFNATAPWESAPRVFRVVEHAKEWRDDHADLVAVEVRT